MGKNYNKEPRFAVATNFIGLDFDYFHTEIDPKLKGNFYIDLS